MRQDVAYGLIALVVIGAGLLLWRTFRKQRPGRSLRIDLFHEEER